jgi:hypothetical protein
LKTKLIALNVLLLSALLAVGWQAKLRYDEAQARRRAGLNVKVVSPPVPPPAPVPKPDSPAAAQYGDVAQKDLFSKDRNPNIIIDAPPPQAPPKPMPPLPVMYGVMGLPSGVRALMAEKAGAASHPVRAGETIGDFKVLSLDAQNIVFEWDGKSVPRKVEDLMDRSTTASATGQGGPAVASNGAPLRQTPVQLTQQEILNQPPPPTAQPASSVPPKLGIDIGAPGRPERSCTPDDTSPSGTVLDGFRKQVTNTIFGPQCRWLPTQ